VCGALECDAVRSLRLAFIEMVTKFAIRERISSGPSPFCYFTRGFAVVASGNLEDRLIKSF